MLKGEFETNANLGDVRELLTQWMHVKEAVRLQHVRAHKGDNSNEMADANAKLAAEAGELIPQATFRADGAFAFSRGGGTNYWRTSKEDSSSSFILCSMSSCPSHIFQHLFYVNLYFMRFDYYCV